MSDEQLLEAVGAAEPGSDEHYGLIMEVCARGLKDPEAGQTACDYLPDLKCRLGLRRPGAAPPLPFDFDVTRQADEAGHRLRVFRGDAGDVHVAVMVAGHWVSVEFCTRQGGGRSPKTRLALVALAEAMMQDNEGCPVGLSPSYPPHWDDKR